MAVADREIAKGGKDSSAPDGVGVEQKKEVNNVYAQMLRGEVTEEVKELRYEMYQADRKSYEYTYTGGGHAKKNNVFSFNGSADEDDGLAIEIVQENDVIPISLTDYGIVSYGEHTAYDDTKDNDPDELHGGERRIHVKYDFNPRFDISKFARKVVVKKTTDPQKKKLDVYFWDCPSQFERLSRLFVNHITNVYNKKERPDNFEITALSFISYKAYGTDATKLYAYVNLQYAGIKKFDGSFVVSYIGDVEENGTDLLMDVYHEKTEEKIKNKEARNCQTTLSLSDAMETMKEPEVTMDEANKIFENVGNG